MINNQQYFVGLSQRYFYHREIITEMLLSQRYFYHREIITEILLSQRNYHKDAFLASL